MYKSNSYCSWPKEILLIFYSQMCELHIIKHWTPYNNSWLLHHKNPYITIYSTWDSGIFYIFFPYTYKCAISWESNAIYLLIVSRFTFEQFLADSQCLRTFICLFLYGFKSWLNFHSVHTLSFLFYFQDRWQSSRPSQNSLNPGADGWSTNEFLISAITHFCCFSTS